MKLSRTNQINLENIDAIVIPVFMSKSPEKILSSYPEARPFIERLKFKGKIDEIIAYYSSETKKLIVIVGAGNGRKIHDSIKCAKSIITSLRQHRISNAVIHFLQEIHLPKTFWCNFTDYLMINEYRFDMYLKEKNDKLKSIELLIETPTEPKEGLIEEREIIYKSVERVRNLINETPSKVNPDALVNEFRSVAEANSLEITVLRSAEIKQHGWNGLAAVGAASFYEPALVHLRYTPEDNDYKTSAIFIGKGITFDAGGLNIKTGNSMVDMKCDMAGAAAVLGIIEAASRLKLSVKIDAIVPLAENVIGKYAFKPGDVITYSNRKTVEITNTDAEGRLILADALIMASRMKPDFIVELSTLTDAIISALGEGIAGVIGTDNELIATLLESGKNTGERLWQLPFVDDYKESIKSRIADMKNSGYGRASAIKAALFLSEFVDDIPFAHIDIAGTSFLSKANSFYAEDGATGFGVRLILDFLKSY